MKSHTSVEFPACRVQRQQTIARVDQGFTLIELLVVIAIIAMLAALVVPAVSRSINRASSVTSKNNLRQIFIAIQRYASDHDDKLPGPLWATAYPERTTWNDEPDGAKNALESLLVPYLGYKILGLSPDGKKEYLYPAFDYPAFKRGQRGDNVPSYYIWRAFKVDGTTYNPMGYMPNVTNTMKFTHVGTIAPANRPFILEPDRELLPGKSYSDSLPLEPFHGDRNALFFGGYVGVTERGSLQELDN
jgi:prepilin-type N-terminal cleavage/methylation domain-containing protein